MVNRARKREASYLLGKPLASRLPFEEEQPLPMAVVASTFPAHKRFKEAAETRERDGDLDHHTCAQRETIEMRQAFGKKEDFAATRSWWLAGRRSCQDGGDEVSGRTGGASSALGRQPEEEGATVAAAAAAPTPIAARAPGRGRVLVQLKIDAMFGAHGLPSSSSSPSPPMNDSSARFSQQGAGPLGGAESDGRAERGMDVDCRGGAAVDAPEGKGGGGASCYACRGGLGTEGGDVLCSFCDRAACRECWQNCSACEIPHCSLCLAADYSSQFECYFCPPCFRERRLESC